MTCIRVLAALALCAFAHAGHAQTYPVKPVRVLIGFPAGSAGEAQLRLVGQKLYEAWGRPLVIDARPGASGNIAAELAVKAPGDGYTLLYFPAALAVNPSLFPAVPYDIARDFTPLTGLGAEPSGMPPQEFGRFMLTEATKWKKLVVMTGARID